MYGGERPSFDFQLSRPLIDKGTKFHQRICTAAGLEDNTINAADQNASASAGASKGKAKGNARSAAPKRARAARAKMTKSHQEGVGGCRGR
ncbi:hypothetical protein PG988_011891 [Apiospora saccharicola]